MGWTDKRVADLKKLWLDGFSASQIAKQLGGVTRNAVIGKVHRLGLAGRKEPARPSAPRPRTPTPRGPARAPRPVAPPSPPVEAVAAPAPPPRPAVIDLPGTATIHTLGSHACKWPIGDPSTDEFSFCGRGSDDGHPYCVEHAKVAYQPARKSTGASELARSLRRYI